MSSFATSLAHWLVDVYVMSSVVLGLAYLAFVLSRQPAQRVAVVWCALIGLAGLLFLTVLPAWPRLSLGLVMVDDAPQQLTTLPRTQSRTIVEATSNASVPAQARLPSVQPLQAESTVEGDCKPKVAGTLRVPSTKNNTVFAFWLRHTKCAYYFADTLLGTWRPLTMHKAFAAALVLAYATGVGGVLGWLAWGRCCTGLIFLNSVRASASLQRALARCAAGHTARAQLLISGNIDQPLAMGLLRPAVYLPERLATYRNGWRQVTTGQPSKRPSFTS